MRLYYDRRGKYRGYSIGLPGVIAAGLIVGALALAFGYQLFLLAPILVFFAFVIWFGRDTIRRMRGRHNVKPAAGRDSAKPARS